MSFNLEQGSALTYAAALTAAGHVTGLTGAATTHSTPLLTYALNGFAYTKAAAAGAATPTTDFNTGAAITLVAGQARAVVWGLQANGTIRVVAGPVSPCLDGSGNAIVGVGCHLPGLPADFVPIAVITIQGGSTLSGTWTFGSSNWNATGLTIGTGAGAAIGSGTATSVAQLPNKALIAV